MAALLLFDPLTTYWGHCRGDYGEKPRHDCVCLYVVRMAAERLSTG